MPPTGGSTVSVPRTAEPPTGSSGAVMASWADAGPATPRARAVARTRGFRNRNKVLLSSVVDARGPDTLWSYAGASMMRRSADTRPTDMGGFGPTDLAYPIG